MALSSSEAFIFSYTPISLRARLIWFYMSSTCDVDVREQWIPYKDLAICLKSSRSTIGRAMQELRQAQLLVDTKRRHGRYKIYEVRDMPVEFEKKPRVRKPKPIAVSPMEEEVQMYMHIHGAYWTKEYHRLDGKENRHSIIFFVRGVLSSSEESCARYGATRFHVIERVLRDQHRLLEPRY